MLKTVTIRTTIPESRKVYLELELPIDTPLGEADFVIVFPTQETPLPEPADIEAGYQLLLTMGDQAVHLPSGSPTDIAANHDDYLYDEL